MARACAKALGYLYVDTGAIYRTVGYYMRLMGIGPKDQDGIRRLIDEVNIDIRYADGVQHMILNGEDVTSELRTPEMSMYASGVSAQPCVRAFLLDMQRQLARTHNVIMDGRDIGTVVLPHADVKIFLTADAEVRAKRRYDELQQKGDKTPMRRSSPRRSSATSRTPSAPPRRSGRRPTPSCSIPPAIPWSNRSRQFWRSSGGSSGEILVSCLLVDCADRPVFLASRLSCGGAGAYPPPAAACSARITPEWPIRSGSCSRCRKKRMIRIMAKQELRRVPFVGWVMEKIPRIFVNRGAHDIAAYQQCVDALEQEHDKMLVFIEGTRCNRDKHVRAKTGAVRMAAVSGAPVVPVFVTRNKTPFCPIRVIFGEPYPVHVDPEDHAACQQASDALLKTIYQLGGDSYADQIS